jgi:disulfide bond formation protein DsbB
MKPWQRIVFWIIFISSMLLIISFLQVTFMIWLPIFLLIIWFILAIFGIIIYPTRIYAREDQPIVQTAYIVPLFEDFLVPQLKVKR